jgi:hypothetical protein
VNLSVWFNSGVQVTRYSVGEVEKSETESTKQEQARHGSDPAEDVVEDEILSYD